MTVDFQPWLFALDLADIAFAAFVIISFLSWVFQVMGANQDKKDQKTARNRRQQRREQKESFESEIERFLQEVNDPGANREREGRDMNRGQEQDRPRRREPERRAQPVARSRPARTLDEEFELEIVEEPPARTPPRRRQREQRRAQQAPVAQQSSPLIQRKSESISDRTLENKTLGSGVSSHVDDYLNRESRSHEAHFRSLGQGVVSSVTSHLGSAGMQPPPPAVQERAAKVRALFNNQETIRQAILVNEILSPPKSLR